MSLCDKPELLVAAACQVGGKSEIRSQSIDMTQQEQPPHQQQQQQQRQTVQQTIKRYFRRNNKCSFVKNEMNKDAAACDAVKKNGGDSKSCKMIRSISISFR